MLGALLLALALAAAAPAGPGAIPAISPGGSSATSPGGSSAAPTDGAVPAAGPRAAQFTAPGQQEAPLYSVLLVRAAPGRLLDLIEAYRERFRPAEGQPPRAYLLRHSQGDQWDLMLLVPHGANAVIVRPERAPEFDAAWDELVAWREEVLVRGPDIEAVRAALEGSGYFHVEMFVALPGKRSALVEQRRMENAFLRGIERPENLIFLRVGGAAWDLFTLGAYRDLKHFAESVDVPAELEERAARAAGFEGADRIGTYLRTLIAYHHDTLAVPVR